MGWLLGSKRHWQWEALAVGWLLGSGRCWLWEVLAVRGVAVAAV